MLYLFYGSDVDKVRAKAFEWVAKARAKEPGLVYVRLAKEELSESALLDAASAGGLFVQRLLVLIDDPFARAQARLEEEEEGGEESASPVEALLDVLAASDNAIVILAPKLPAAKAKKIQAKAKMVYEYTAPARTEERGFNTGLVNALSSRSRERLWLEIVRALRSGDAPEMLHGLLHWKARDLMEKGSRAWTDTEARALSRELIGLLQESRRGGLPLQEALERFALSV